MAEFSPTVLIWWASLSAISIVNIALWLIIARRIHTTDRATPGLTRYRTQQLACSAFFVFGCASRSFVIRSDVNRFSMVDTVFASAFVGRSIASVAEVMFVAQWALLLYALSIRRGRPSGTWLARVLVPIILVAETCSWYGILTTNSLGNAIEESLWTLTAALFMGGLAMHLRDASPALRRFLVAALLTCTGYLVYMVTMDVPMYVAKWQAAEAAGRVYFGFAEGVADALTYTVTGSWEDWKHDVLWQSLYFSLAVWVSLVLVVAPELPEDST